MAYQTWLSDPRVIGVTPFMLQDSYWGEKCGYGYVKTDGNKWPVFGAVKAYRCEVARWTGGC